MCRLHPSELYKVLIAYIVNYHRMLEQNKNALKEADQYGIDLTLIEENLRKSFEDRINAQSTAANALRVLREAKLKADE